MKNRYIGDRAFYRRVFGVAVPIIVQTGITNFVSMLDNIMVGQIGTMPMSGVSIVNGLIFVFNLCIFGASSGAGIFTAQFFGSHDDEGVRYTFRFKFLICSLLSALGMALLLFWDRFFIGLYLTGEGNPAEAAEILNYGVQYLHIMAWGFLPFALTNAYSSTLKETGNTFVPMVAGIIATLVNLVGNYILIFGHFGAPQMGVQGAALATVVSRFVELAIVAGWTHRNSTQNPFIIGVYRSFYLPGRLLKIITLKGMPLLVNEALWSSGMAILNQCYSTCGLDVVQAMSISSTIYNLAAVVFRSLGNVVGIFMGQMLGARRPTEELMDTNRKMTALAAFSGVIFGAVVLSLSGVFPLVYNTSEAVRRLATNTIIISAVLMPLQAYSFPVYFTLRAGGKTVVTTLFDCGAIWFLYLPISFLLSRFTGLPFLTIYAICNCTDLIKCIVGTILIRSGTWIQHLTGPEKA